MPTQPTKTVEKGIRAYLDNKGNAKYYYARISLKGYLFFKSCKTLKEAREYKKEVLTGKIPTSEAQKEPNCITPKEIRLSSTVSFDWDGDRKAPVLKIKDGDKEKTYSIPPKKVREVRDFLSMSIRRHKSGLRSKKEIRRVQSREDRTSKDPEDQQKLFSDI